MCGHEPDSEDGQDEEGRQECDDAGEPRMTSSTVDAVPRGMAAPHAVGYVALDWRPIAQVAIRAELRHTLERFNTLARSRREVGRGGISKLLIDNSST